MSRLSLPASFSEFIEGIGPRRRRVGFALVTCLFALLTALGAGGNARAQDGASGGIELDLRPRVCTLTEDDESCDTVVTAQWRAPKDESLCLLIVSQPQIRQCWENHDRGVYTVRLVFNTDLVVELRDPQLQNVLASAAITVIKEAIRLRRKRRQPWDILSFRTDAPTTRNLT